MLGRDLDGNPIGWKLVMHELTHDLDIETLELLESLLVDYQGTVLPVSHDRGCLNDVVTSTLVIEDDGLVKEEEEGYGDDLRQCPAEPVSESRPNSDVPRKKAADAPREQSRKLSCKERKEPRHAAPDGTVREDRAGSARRDGPTVVLPPRSRRDRRREEASGGP